MLSALRLPPINMTLPAKVLAAVIAILLWTTSAFAASDASVCPELSGYFTNKQTSKFPDPSREPTQTERAFIDKSKIQLLERTDYAMGVSMVDADNDGKEDLFVWNVQGSGRFVSAELFDIPSQQSAQAKELDPKASMDLGVLAEPRFVRFKGVNYIASTDTGDSDGAIITRLAKDKDGRYELLTVCQMQTTVKADKTCRHPACRKLQEMVETKTENAPFVNVEWPHKYFAPAGLEVFFAEDWSDGDFDNTGKSTSIWRIGREGYINQHIYWALLGQGDQLPKVDRKLRPLSEDQTVRRVLPGLEHERLRRTLAQQSEAMSSQLRRPISLPNEGQFFLFNANNNRTYWAWDFGEPPYGEEIHIMYTNARKSDYVGVVRLMRNQALEPCASKCVTSLMP
jgi:hypothetical protein